jgi:hypothetical protein
MVTHSLTELTDMSWSQPTTMFHTIIPEALWQKYVDSHLELAMTMDQ